MVEVVPLSFTIQQDTVYSSWFNNDEELFMKGSENRYGPVEEFAAFALLTLLREPNTWHPLYELCAASDTGVISHSYAEQTLKMLVAGLPIRSQRGPGGGYRAGEGLGQKTMLDVLKALGQAPRKPQSTWARAKNRNLESVRLSELTYE